MRFFLKYNFILSLLATTAFAYAANDDKITALQLAQFNKLLSKLIAFQSLMSIRRLGDKLAEVEVTQACLKYTKIVSFECRHYNG